jgi:hypothetical protein
MKKLGGRSMTAVVIGMFLIDWMGVSVIGTSAYLQKQPDSARKMTNGLLMLVQELRIKRS